MTMHSFPPPLNHQDFETLTVMVTEFRLLGSSAVPHGRNGQAQQGVDVIVTMPDQSVIGMQCKWKGREGKLTLEEIREECEKAKGFEPELRKLYVCTTAEPDAVLQRETRALEYDFPVEIWAWDTFNDALNRSDELAESHRRSSAKLDRAGFERAHALELREALDRPAYETEVWSEGNFQFQLEALEATLAFLKTGRLYDRPGEPVRGVLPMSRYEGAYLNGLIDLEAAIKKMRTCLRRHVKAIESSDFEFSRATAEAAEVARLKVLVAGAEAFRLGGI